jgi:hypothetical protein
LREVAVLGSGGSSAPGLRAKVVACWHSPGTEATFQCPPPGALVTAVNSPLLAEALRDRYVLERELGRGGMVTVYLAQDLHHDRPHILTVLDSGEAAGLLWYTMPYVEGESLR